MKKTASFLAATATATAVLTLPSPTGAYDLWLVSQPRSIPVGGTI